MISDMFKYNGSGADEFVYNGSGADELEYSASGADELEYSASGTEEFDYSSASGAEEFDYSASGAEEFDYSASGAEELVYSPSGAVEFIYSTTGATDSPESITAVDKYYPEKMDGFDWVIGNTKLVLLYPMAMALNVVLFVSIVKSFKVHKEPWRWLIAHTSICIFATSFEIFIGQFTIVHHLPSLLTSSLCPAYVTLDAILRRIVVISFVLVAIERFRALRLGSLNEGGMSKMAVILSVSLFWLLLVIVQVIPLAVEPIFSGREPFVFIDLTPDYQMCYVAPLAIPAIARIVFTLWPLITIFTVIIGIIILGWRENTTSQMKQSVVVPTLCFGVPFLVFVVGSECIHALLSFGLIPYSGTHLYVYHVFYLLLLLTWILFPIVWLVTWTNNGDISWNWKKLCPCGHRQNEENTYLLDPK